MTSLKEISVICPSCQRSVIVSFSMSNQELYLDSDACPYCDFDWLDDITDQICEDLEDEPEYDEEIEDCRQEDYDQQFCGRIFEYYEN